MHHEFTAWTQTLLSNDPPLPRYSILHISLIHVLPSFGTHAFTTSDLANKFMESRKWRVWLTHRNTLICPPALAQAGDDTRIHLVLPSVPTLIPASYCPTAWLAGRVSRGHSWEKPVLRFPCTDVEQLPASTLWSNLSTNPDWQTAWEGAHIHGRGTHQTPLSTVRC